MPRKSNRDKERHYFEMFRRRHPLPPGIVEYCDKPDVLLKGERSIGIEITNFFLQEGNVAECEQVQRSVRDKVVSKAQRMYQAQNGRKFELTFEFDKAVPISDQNELSKKIAKLAKLVETRGSGQVCGDVLRDIPEVSFAYLNTTEYENATWRVQQAHTTPVMSMERLKEIVKEKELKSRDYRPCDAYWLLVVVDFIDSAQDQEIQIDGFAPLVSKVFEKIFVYKTCFDQLLEAGTIAR